VALICGIDPRQYATGHISYVQAHALAAAMAGFSPQIFCVGRPAGIERTRYGVLHRVATPVHHFTVAPSYPRPLAIAIADYLQSCGHEPPYVIHGFGPWAASATSAVAALERRGVAAVAVVSAYTTVTHEWGAIVRALGGSRSRAAIFYRAWYPWIRTVTARTERHGLERARLVLANYDSVAALVREEYGQGLAVRRMPYASAVAFRSAAELARAPAPACLARLRPAGAPLIVCVSRQMPRKGIPGLLRALAALRSEGVEFRACLVGPGRQLEAHRQLAAGLGLSESVALPGRVEDVYPYLKAADVFALPSLEEGSGSVSLLEALQAGTAVVASSCDGIPEDIDDGVTGLLVPPGDERALAEALRRLLLDPELRDRLAAGARALYLDRFTAARFSAALGAVYDELRVR
jgi:glycosyltransferase involved in cell wall biosynthesis